VKGWELIEGKKIKKVFKFKDCIEAKYFVDIISIIAEEHGHHPNITIIYNKVTITLTTHGIGGLSGNDFIMAKFIDELEE
ncbi:MAG: 4a-hydroxytetrahydrobiopterin dehydratase, partial [Candidatus Omnitrophica bacterium]|nr:4a-hydroxytetrahydrobiopterin dehydratase [Candidatus Omnitrophota bacterium]